MRALTATFTTARFGTVSFDPADSGYVARTTGADGRIATPSLFVAGLTDPALLARAAAMVDALDVLDPRARAALGADLETEPSSAGTVADFLRFHLEELPADELRRYLGRPETATVEPPELLAALQLVGIGVHAAEPAGFVVGLDYSVGPGVSDELLVVRFAPDGQVVRVSHES